jgi:hypothetical protein
MPNHALDPLFHALFFKFVPLMIGAGIVGILLREFFQWFERSVYRVAKSRREVRKIDSSDNLSGSNSGSEDAPAACPSCGSEMVMRKAKRGPKPGTSFWGCTRFSAGCRGTRQVA